MPDSSIDDRDPDRVEAEDKQLCIDGLKHGERYKITIREGLPAAVDETLAKSVELAVFVKDRDPSVRVSGRSYVLPRVGQNGIPIVTVNTTTVAISIYRIGDRNLAQQIVDGQFASQLGEWDVETIERRNGQKVYSGEVATKTKRNEEVTTAVPVSDALPDMKPGVYAMIARPVSTGSNQGDRATQWFIVSDLGLTAISADDGVHAFVRSLETADVKGEVTVRLIARNNEILAETNTDADGYARFEPGVARGEDAMAPALLIASTEAGDYAFLDLSAAAFDLTDRGVKGRDAPGPIDGYLYTDRGVFRPGETVNATALVRSRDGRAAELPATIIVARPDGVEFRRAALVDQGHGGRTVPVALPTDAMTGTWRFKVHLDPKADPIAETAVLVEDFMPERLALEVASAAEAISPGAQSEVTLKGRYLYGPPAQDLAVEGDVVVRPASGGDSKHPGYQFGRADILVAPVRTPIETDARTDADGIARLAVALPPIPKTDRPLEAQILLRLREPGGRTIERSLTRPIQNPDARIGVRPLFKDGRLGEGETAEFDIIAVDGTNTVADRAGIAWQIMRLERTWQWYKRDGQWSYDSAVISRKVAAGVVDASAKQPVRIANKLDWGRYRLELTASDASNGTPITTTFDFSTGWYQGEDADSPEILDVALDKPTYGSGETARIKISTRAGGKATVTILGSRLHASRVVDIPAGNSEIAIPVGADWGSGAYAAVTLHRPMDVANKRMPSRALGLVWISRDLAGETIAVKLDAPERTRSATSVKVPFTLSNLAPGEDARITIAAVDVGILNLTGFKSPSPESRFHAQTRLGAELRDLYGRLIDGMRAERGTMRTGGDMDGSLSMQGPPPVSRTVALFSGIVSVGPDGKGSVSFEMPEFNGAVRLMAVAWSASRIGHASSDMIVRDPVALTIATPRFLTLGDRSQMLVDLHNIEGVAGDYTVTITAAADGKPVRTLSNETLQLKADERRQVAMPLVPDAAGSTTVTTTIAGPKGLTVRRAFTVDVMPPGGDVRRTRMFSLAANAKTDVGMDALSGLIAETAELSLSVGPTARINVPALLASLDRYPYGCTEQTISRALPLLYANALATSSGMAADDKLQERIQSAIARVLTRQDSSGAFGIWGPSAPDLWLTSYTADFLTRAREEGYAVDQRAFSQAVDRLANFVAYEQEIRGGGTDLAYALYVLARNGRAPAGELRYWAESKLSEFTTPLAKAQLAAALTMIGDQARAERVFEAAFAALDIEGARDVRPDFGSGLRDTAAVIALAAEAKYAGGTAATQRALADAYGRRTRTSTQEEAWLLLAAKALDDRKADVRLDLAGQSHTGALRRSLAAADLTTAALTIRNTGTEATDVVLTAVGSGAEPLPAEANGFEVERAYYTLAGQKIELASANGGTATVRQNDRLVAVVTVRAKQTGGRILLVDRLPAGLEIENPRLVDSGSLSGLAWLEQKYAPDHTEFRDDRFVASFNLFGSQAEGDGTQTLTVAYVVRAVTPGTYVHPAASVEDMYRPEWFARTGSGQLTVTTER